MRFDRPLIHFFVLVVALSLPLWLLGAAAAVQLVDGLPVSALMIVCPLVAAVIVARRNDGAVAPVALLKSPFDYSKFEGKVSYFAMVLKPAIMVLSYWLMRWMGLPLPTPRISVAIVPTMLVAFFAAAIAEEVGWSGFATPRMQASRSALSAAILLGLFWAAWHVIPLMQAHRPIGWIVWHGLETVATRVLIVWVYNNTTGSVFAAALFHAVDNVSWLMFPNFGSHYNPRITAPITVGVAAIVAVVWGPSTLRRDGGAVKMR